MQISKPIHEGREGGGRQSLLLYLLSTLSVRMKTLPYLQHSLQGAARLISSVYPRDSAYDGGRTHVTSLLDIYIIVEEIELAMLLNRSLRERTRERQRKKIYISTIVWFSRAWINACRGVETAWCECRRRLHLTVIFSCSSKIRNILNESIMIMPDYYYFFFFCAFVTKRSEMPLLASPRMSVLDSA
jgi:hypothetical protein